MRIGVVSNMRSQRNKRGLGDLARALAQAPEAIHRELHGVDGLAPALDEFVEAGVAAIAVNGGDGTVQATLGHFLATGRAVPIVAALPGGMTNLIAGDVGRSRKRGPALSRLIDQGRRGRIETTPRAALEMRLDEAAAPVYGAFFGGAAIYRAIKLCRREVHTRGLESAAASAATLGAVLARRLTGRAGAAGPHDEVFRGDDIRLSLDGGPWRETRVLLILATTLSRLVLRSRPFWGHGAGAIRLTAIDHPPPRLGRAIAPLLYGGPDRRMPEGYRSTRAREVRLDMAAPFTLDGELYEPTPGRPVILREGPVVEFARV